MPPPCALPPNDRLCTGSSRVNSCSARVMATSLSISANWDYGFEVLGEPATRLVEHGREGGIIAQGIVVDQVLVAERDSEDALAQPVGDRMADGVGHAQIG